MTVSRLRFRLRAIAWVCGCLLLAGPAGAVDWCFSSLTENPTSESPNVIFAVPKFKLPKKGKCAVMGAWEYAAAGDLGRPRPLSPTICMNSAGDTLYVTAFLLPTFVGNLYARGFSVTMTIPYPETDSGAGTASLVRAEENGVTSARGSGAGAGPCFVNPTPIP